MTPLFRSLPQALLAACHLAAMAAEPAITNCLEALTLPPAQAAENRPVLLTATITCYIPGSQLCFVQDATAGIYVFPFSWPNDLDEGDVVEVRGVTGKGRFSSIVQMAAFRKTGGKETVAPKRINLEELRTGKFDCQWVELEGVAQSIQFDDSMTTLRIWTGGNDASVLLFAEIPPGANWVDARLRLRGVAGTFYDKDRLTRCGLLIHRASDIEVIETAADPFTRPLVPIQKPFAFSREGKMDHRVRVQGIVSVCWPGEATFIQDEAGAMRIAGHGTNIFQPGDFVEASGFLRDFTGAQYLAGAVMRKLGTNPVSSQPMSADMLKNDARPILVWLEGTALHMQTRRAGASLTLESGGRIVTAYAPAALPPNLRGARVRVSGVWNAPPAAWEQAPPGLWLAKNEVQVLERSPPGVPATASAAYSAGPIFGMAAAGLAVVLGGVACFTGMRARARTREAESARELLRENEKELLQLNEARERLGRDLHDHIIQSIYAVGLNLDDCAQRLRLEPENVESRLKGALGDVNGVIRELRNVILGLETNAIQPNEFRAAIKSLSLALGSENSNRIRLDIEQSAMDSLSPQQATELVHIAREALSNSLRHGRAETTTFTLQNLEQQVRFIVEDDGRGFEIASSSGKGFGLRNMATRARNLHAAFDLSSQPGRGTRIVLDIPRQKHHFSGHESGSHSAR